VLDQSEDCKPLSVLCKTYGIAMLRFIPNMVELLANKPDSTSVPFFRGRRHRDAKETLPLSVKISQVGIMVGPPHIHLNVLVPVKNHMRYQPKLPFQKSVCDITCFNTSFNYKGEADTLNSSDNVVFYTV